MACTLAHIGMDPFMEKFNVELGQSNKGRFRQRSKEQGPMKSKIPIGLSLNGALVASACLSYLPIYLSNYIHDLFFNRRGCPSETQHQFTIWTIGFHQQLSCNRLAKDGSLGQHEPAPTNTPFGCTLQFKLYCKCFLMHCHHVVSRHFVVTTSSAANTSSCSAIMFSHSALLSLALTFFHVLIL